MPSPATSIILLVHGSRSRESSRAAAALGDRVAPLLGGVPVEVAHLQLAAPTLEEAVDRCVAGGSRRVVVVPVFLFPGVHVRQDIPALVADLRVRHPGLEIRTADILGDHPLVAEAVAARAREVSG